MSTTITTEQVRDLWDAPNPAAMIDRGGDYEPVTKEDLGVLASDLDTDDDGYPLPGQWEVLADQLNSNPPGEPTSTSGATLLQQIADARGNRDQVKARADAEFNDLIRAGVASKKAPVAAIAAAAGLSPARVYQIRDRRR